MNIFVYSDESGVFDKAHNDFFVFGGLIFLDKNERDMWSRKYTAAEKTIRKIESFSPGDEVKATSVANKSKGKLYRSLNNTEKFGIVINQKGVNDEIFQNKKTKQRYLDWAFKMAVKEKLQLLIRCGVINTDAVENMYFYVDEHTTATDGIYELKESLETEFKIGIHNFERMTFHPPLFKNLKTVSVKYCNSSTTTLVRAADIVANNIYHKAVKYHGNVNTNNKLCIKKHPN